MAALDIMYVSGNTVSMCKAGRKKNLNIKAGERFGKSVQVDGKI